MRRREFISALGGIVAGWPLAARAQPAALPLVAFVSLGTADTLRDRSAGFRKGLGEVGYVEGQNVQIEYHWLDGDYSRAADLLDELIRRQVAVIAIPGSTPISLAAKTKTSTVPIVFAVAENPVTLGLVTDLAHPGGNATGINFLAIEIEAKRLGLMHELLPKATRFAVLLNPVNVQYTEATTISLTNAARDLGIEISFYKASTPEEIDARFEEIVRDRANALFIATEAFFASRGVQVATLAIRHRLPASFASREVARLGLLMSYGADFEDMARRVGAYAGAILKGAHPAEMPVVQATKLDLVINLQTAKTLGLDIPHMLLARADEVIE